MLVTDVNRKGHKRDYEGRNSPRDHHPVRARPGGEDPKGYANRAVERADEHNHHEPYSPLRLIHLSLNADPSGLSTRGRLPRLPMLHLPGPVYIEPAST